MIDSRKDPPHDTPHDPWKSPQNICRAKFKIYVFEQHISIHLDYTVLQ